MGMNIEFSDLIALAAFGLSFYSVVKTYQFNQKQKEFMVTNDALNKMLLRKETKEAMDDFSADLSANFIKLGSQGRRLKIFNKGKGVANNVRIEFPEGNDLVLKSEVTDKFPLNLESFQYVELLVTDEMGSPRKLTIKLIWDDRNKTDNFKLLTPTL